MKAVPVFSSKVFGGGPFSARQHVHIVTQLRYDICERLRTETSPVLDSFMLMRALLIEQITEES